MRLLTILAVATLAAGVYHYRRQLGRTRETRQARSNDRLAEAVRSATAGKTSRPVAVRCVRGVATLRGTLPTAERDRVLAAALSVPGVVQVTSLIETDEAIGDLGPMQSAIATGP